MIQAIDRLTAWKLLLHHGSHGREGAIEAMVELDDGIPVTWTSETFNAVRLRLFDGVYYVECDYGVAKLIVEARTSQEAETDVPDLSHINPVTAQAVDDLVNDAQDAMQDTINAVTQYLAETDDEALRARLVRLGAMCRAMLAELPGT